MKSLLKELNSGKIEISEGGIILPKSKIEIGGYFTTDVNGEDVQKHKNIVVDEGLIYVINTSLAAVAQQASWFVGIFQNNYTPVPADTAALFPGAGVANEINAEYTEGTRPAYTPNVTNLTNVSNSSVPATFTINAAVSAYGAFLVSDSVKTGTTGVLCAASKFTAVRNLVNADVLNVSYQLTIADA